MSAPERDDAQMALAAALVRLRQYGEQTATYTDAAEKALHQIALTLAAEVSSLSDEVTGARLSLWEDGQENLRLRLALTSAQRGRRELRTRLEAFEALELGTPEGRVSAKCEDASHPVWLRDLDDVRGCPWCRVAELEALTPAPIQTCQSCGAGYDYGQPCSVCEFKARIAAEIAKAEAEDSYEEKVAAYLATPYTDDTRRPVRRFSQLEEVVQGVETAIAPLTGDAREGADMVLAYLRTLTAPNTAVPSAPVDPHHVTEEQARRIERDRPETDTSHECNIPLTRRLDCGHCPHEVCQDCQRCPHTCRCATGEDPHDGPLHHDYAHGRDLPEVTR